MKFYKTSQRDEKQQPSENRKTKKFMPTYTVGSALREEPSITNDPIGELLYASKRMHKDGQVSRLFSPLTSGTQKQEEIL